MKIKTTLAVLAAFALLVGCATQPRGPACGHEQEFRRQLADSVPVKDWGYKIQDLRFSEDYHKALVTFAVPGKTAGQEVVLKEDDFCRYSGEVYDPDRQTASKPPGLATLTQRDSDTLAGDIRRYVLQWKASITVTYPRQHTSPAYKYEQEFRRQLANSVPVKDWGYKIQEVRFSGDCHKALVVCLDPAAAKSREFTMEDDGFRRFSCPLFDEKNDFRILGSLTITLPDK